MPQILVARILDKEVVGGKLCRRDREDALVGRKGLTCKGIATLVGPEIVGGIVEAESDQIGAAVGFPHEFAGSFGLEEGGSDLRRRSDPGPA
jgi:hypothetical protein